MSLDLSIGILQRLNGEEEPGAARQSAFLSRVLGYLLILGPAVVLVHHLTAPGRGAAPGAQLAMESAGIAVVAIAYLLNRFGYYRLATVGFLSLSALLVLCLAFGTGDPARGFPVSLYQLVPVALAAVLLPLRWALAFTAVTIVASALPPAVLPGLDYPPGAASYLGFLVVISSTILLSAHHRDMLERTRKREVEQSEKRFRQLAENIPQVFWIATADLGVMEYISPAYETIWGEPCSRIYENPLAWYERVVDEDRPALEPVVAATRTNHDGEHVLPEFRIRRGDGGVRWIRSRIYPVHDRDGNLIRRAGIVEDITERKRAEEDVQRNRDRLQSIIDNAPVFIYIVDLENRFLVVNRQYEEFFGVKSRDILGQRGDLLVPPGFLGELEEENRRVREARTPLTFEEGITHTDGKAYRMLTTKFPLCDSEGTIYAIGGITTDVTAYKTAEEALYESERRYHMLISNIPYVTWISEGGGKTVFISENVGEVCGYGPEEVCGMGSRLWFERMHPDDIPRVKELWEALFSRGESFDTEYRLQRRDGAWIRIRDRSVDTYERNGVRYAYGLLADVTARRAAEEEKRRLEEQLRQSEKMEAVGQLAGGIAHDFNNQLAGIVGYADMIRSQAETRGVSTLVRYAEGVLTAARHASDLTEQLLAFARKGKLQSVPVDIHSILDEVVALLTHSIDKRISIHRDFRARTPTTRGDPTQLQNVFLNMALNARDAMPEGGELVFATEVVEVKAGYARRRRLGIPAGSYLRISVSDTGTGMDAATLKHIFEPFFTTKEQGRGTGMGLAAAFGTIHNHHGAIDVKSAAGRGTTFRIFLPPAGKPKETEPKPGGGDAVEGGIGTVMLVEDEPVVRHMAAELTKHLGYTVVECADGAEALERYAASWRQIDLVILDMVMPEMNGREVYRELRRINPDAAVLVSSGYSLDSETHAMLSNGVKGFLRKPFRRAELARAIRAALGDGAAK